MTVQRAMIANKEFIMVEVTWSGCAKKRNDKPPSLPANSTSCLNVVGCCLRLTMHHHESKPLYIDTSAKHGSGEQGIDIIVREFGKSVKFPGYFK
jgi:hypothetical protein